MTWPTCSEWCTAMSWKLFRWKVASLLRKPVKLHIAAAVDKEKKEKIKASKNELFTLIQSEFPQHIQFRSTFSSWAQALWRLGSKWSSKWLSATLRSLSDWRIWRAWKLGRPRSLLSARTWPPWRHWCWQCPHEEGGQVQQSHLWRKSSAGDRHSQRDVRCPLFHLLLVEAPPIQNCCAGWTPWWWPSSALRTLWTSAGTSFWHLMAKIFGNCPSSGLRVWWLAPA